MFEKEWQNPSINGEATGWDKVHFKDHHKIGRGGGQVVSSLAFYSDDPSLNHAEVYNFSVKLLLKRTKINKKRPGLTHFFKKITANLIFKFLKFTLSNKIKALFYFFLPRICGYIMIHSSFLLLSRWSWLMGWPVANWWKVDAATYLFIPVVVIVVIGVSTGDRHRPKP